MTRRPSRKSRPTVRKPSIGTGTKTCTSYAKASNPDKIVETQCNVRYPVTTDNTKAKAQIKKLRSDGYTVSRGNYIAVNGKYQVTGFKIEKK
jgi:hypothetical protein